MNPTTEHQGLELSIVVPLYNEEESLPELVDQINEHCPLEALSSSLWTMGQRMHHGILLSN